MTFTEKQNETIHQVKLSAARYFAIAFILICSFIFEELELKKFAYFGDFGFLVGFVISCIVLLGEDWTKAAVLFWYKETIKMFKFVAIISVAIFSIAVAVETKVITFTPNGLMRNLHYYYLNEDVVVNFAILIALSIIIFNWIKSFKAMTRK